MGCSGSKQAIPSQPSKGTLLPKISDDKKPVQEQATRAEAVTITVSKTPDNDQLGVKGNISADGVFWEVAEVNKGLFQSWNEQSPDFFVEPGDKFAACNGAHGNGQLILLALETDEVLEITVIKKDSSIENPQEAGAPPEVVPTDLEQAVATQLFTVTLIGVGDTEVGLEGEVSAEGDYWEVTAVNGGLVQSWNEMCPGSAVGPGDKIVACNQAHGNGLMIAEAMKESKSLIMTFVKRGASNEDIQAGMLSPIEVLQAANKFDVHHAPADPDLSKVNLKGARIETNEEQTLPEPDFMDSGRKHNGMCCVSRPCCK